MAESKAEPRGEPEAPGSPLPPLRGGSRPSPSLFSVMFLKPTVQISVDLTKLQRKRSLSCRVGPCQSIIDEEPAVSKPYDVTPNTCSKRILRTGWPFSTCLHAA